MIESNQAQDQVISLLRKKFLGLGISVQIPPQVFETMQGRVIDFDAVQGFMKVEFPVLEANLNPFGNLQGGMIAAAIDNTLGPLSMLVAPPNYTRHLEIKYKKPVAGDAGYMTVMCNLEEQKRRQLFFSATVEDKTGCEIARARAIHWIIDY
jgi:acyl-coenzyme A thioesterase PaaI-like protein